MAEYIERGALRRELAPYEENDFSQQMSVILQIVDEQPTVDVAPVVHGRWVPVEEDIIFECSKCECRVSTSWDYDEPDMWNFCPRCGAKMDGGKEDD